MAVSRRALIVLGVAALPFVSACDIPGVPIEYPIITVPDYPASTTTIPPTTTSTVAPITTTTVRPGIDGTRCNGKEATIFEVIDDEDTFEISGTPGDDVIVVIGTRDARVGGLTVRAGDGNDTVCIDTARGLDVVYGQGGDDYIWANNDKRLKTTIYGGDGNDHLVALIEAHGGRGDDFFSSMGGTPTTMRLFGGPGDDQMFDPAQARPPHYYYLGLAGNRIEVTGGDGNDVVPGSGGDGFYRDIASNFIEVTQDGDNGVLD